MRKNTGRICGIRLGRDHNIMADITERLTDFFLTVGIFIGSIKIIDAMIIRTPQQLLGRRMVDSLDRQTPHRRLGDPQVCSSKSNLSNIHPSHLLFPVISTVPPHRAAQKMFYLVGSTSVGLGMGFSRCSTIVRTSSTVPLNPR